MEPQGKYQTREFGFSETSIRERIRTLLVAFLFFAVSAVVFCLFVLNLNLKPALAVSGITLLYLAVIMAIEIPLINWRLRKLKVFVDGDKIVKQCGKKQQVILWKDIARVKTVENKKGGVAQIRIYPRERETAMYLLSFEEMETLASLIREKTRDNVLHRERRCKVNWKNPFVGVLVGGVPTIVVMCVIASMGRTAMDIFTIACAFAIGIGTLVFRPLTKLDAFDKWVESAFAITLIILGIYGLICFLSTGHLR
jgi:membrane protein YdbS with pleckstrin-like domain